MLTEATVASVFVCLSTPAACMTVTAATASQISLTRHSLGPNLCIRVLLVLCSMRQRTAGQGLQGRGMDVCRVSNLMGGDHWELQASTTFCGNLGSYSFLPVVPICKQQSLHLHSAVAKPVSLFRAIPYTCLANARPAANC